MNLLPYLTVFFFFVLSLLSIVFLVESGLSFQRYEIKTRYCMILSCTPDNISDATTLKLQAHNTILKVQIQDSKYDCNRPLIKCYYDPKNIPETFSLKKNYNSLNLLIVLSALTFLSVSICACLMIHLRFSLKRQRERQQQEQQEQQEREQQQHQSQPVSQPSKEMVDMNSSAFVDKPKNLDRETYIKL